MAGDRLRANSRAAFKSNSGHACARARHGPGQKSKGYERVQSLCVATAISLLLLWTACAVLTQPVHECSQDSDSIGLEEFQVLATVLCEEIGGRVALEATFAFLVGPAIATGFLTASRFLSTHFVAMCLVGRSGLDVFCGYTTLSMSPSHECLRIIMCS